MRGRKIAVSVAVAMFTTLLGGSVTGPALAADPIAYNGRAFAVSVNVSGQTTVLADSGELPSSGGNLEASSLTGLAPALTGDTLHASTIGQGDRTRSEASMGSLVVTAGLVTVSADLAMSRATATRHGSQVLLSGTSHVTGLAINGLPVLVTGQPNQSIPLPEGQLIINEQTTSTAGAMKSITVKAVHLTVGDVDAVVGSSRAGATNGAASCSSTADSATGGGWVQPSFQPKQSFGFVGGIRHNGNIHGHLVFVDHATNNRLKGTVTAYTVGGPTLRTMDGEGELNNEPAQFSLTVNDAGEPGTSDTFELAYASQTGGGIATGTLGGGNIQIHEPCS